MVSLSWSIHSSEYMNGTWTYTHSAFGPVSRVQRGAPELAHRYSGEGTLREPRQRRTAAEL